MTGPAGVMALVLAETVAGGATLLFLTPLWNEVRRGFFRLCGAVLLALSAAAWGSIAAGQEGGSEAGRWAYRMSLVLVVLNLLWLALLFARRDKAARVAGFATVPASAGLLIALAGTGEGSFGIAILQLTAGSALMGSVLIGLLLGHWYLTDRGLPRDPINRFSTLLLVSVVLEATAVLITGFGPTEDSPAFNPLLTAAGLAPWISLGMLAATGLIAVMIRLSLRGTRATAVQAATGFFYLAVITAFAGELATKVRFLPQ